MNKLHCDFCNRVIAKNEPVYHRLAVFSVSAYTLLEKTEKQFDLCEECNRIFDVQIKKCIEELRKEIS